MRDGMTWLFRLLAISFLFGAAFHAAAFFDASIEPRMGPTGHAIFVAINLVTAAGMLLRPRGFPIAFAVLVVQQLVSHGDWAWKAWQAGWVDGRSLLVLVTLPLMLVALIYDSAAAGRRRQDGWQARQP